MGGVTTTEAPAAASAAERIARAVLADQRTAGRRVYLGGEQVTLGDLAQAVIDAAVLKLDRCRSCDAPVVWVTTANLKSMPLDPEPVDGGNLVFLTPGQVTHVSKVPKTLARTEDRGTVLPRFKSHYATCPNADQHRRPR